MAKKERPQEDNTDNKTFIQEVDDALHQERLLAFWQRYRAVIIGAVILLFAAVAGKELYTNHTHDTAQQAVDAYITAMEDEDPAALAEIMDEKGPFSALAAIQVARLAREKGDTATAVAAYKAMTDNKNNPPTVRDMGRYYAALLLLDTNPAAAEAHLTPLTGAENNPFRLMALELMGHVLIEKGEPAAAIPFFEEVVADGAAPAALRSRADAALAKLTK